jgi:hypothetical protein
MGVGIQVYFMADLSGELTVILIIKNKNIRELCKKG